ncbi:hypothetical protein K8S19_00240 [bacterium]|nr:hypothetical protein [bacterium]
MASKITSKLTYEYKPTFMRKANWLGTLALFGTLLLFAGVSLSAAEVDDKLLPKIVKQLKEKGKKIKSTSVLEAGEETTIVVTLISGEVKTYDNQGRLKEVKHPDGKITRYEDGMPVEEISPTGETLSTTKYFRSPEGKLRKTIKTGKSGVHIKHFDNKGNVIQNTSPQGTKFYSNYTKNEKGQTTGYVERNMNTGKTEKVFLDSKTGAVQTKIDQNGVRTDMEYQRDANGEMIATIEKDSQGHEKIKKYENGQLVEVIEDGVRTTHENILNEKGVLVMKKERKVLPAAGGTVEDITIKEFNEQGQVTKKTDQMGIHIYSYVLDKDGKIISRFERIESPDGSFEPSEKTTDYDDAGRIIRVVEKGKTANTEYVLDDRGNIVSSTDKITIHLGMMSFTQEIKKEYNEQGQVMAKVDDNGHRTEYVYDAAGNRINSKSEFESTEYTYDTNGNMISSVTIDHKSTTYTEYDIKTKLPAKKIKYKNSGVMELTTYGINDQGKRYGITSEPFGVRVTTYRDSTSEQPEHAVFTKHNGKQTVSTYDYFGDHMVASKEIGESSVTETMYNAFGKPDSSVQTDKWGRVTTTTHQYMNGRSSASISVDKKGKSITKFNKFEEPVSITRINTIGFPRKSVEERIYKDGILVRSVSSDVKGKSYTEYNMYEQAQVVHRVNYHGFPRENWVTNAYNTSGELTNSYQIDSRGYTENDFDDDGLMTESLRLDIYGFPKMKTTTYNYIKGELVTSVSDDTRGTSYNKFNADGLMVESKREKKFGYPRVDYSTFEYDGNGYMVYGESTDANGFTKNWYNIDELVAISYRENTYGHARQQWTINEYDNAGFMTVSKETDLKGCTITQFNRDSLALTNMRFDHYGVEYGRNTMTVNNYDGEGFMVDSLSKNLMTSMAKEFDKDSLCQFQSQKDNFGITYARDKVSDSFVYDGDGRLQNNVSKDLMGATYSTYDIHGDATKTLRLGNYGLEASRISRTGSAFEADTGMTTERVSLTAYGTTWSMEFDPQTGLESLQFSDNNFGLLASRKTTSRIELDKRHGLTRNTLATNDYGKTSTHFDTESEGQYGIAVSSRSINNFGLGYTLDTTTAIDADEKTGQNKTTKAANKYGSTLTEFDTLSGGSHGVAVRSFADNHFGLLASRKTATLIDSDLYNGLNKATVAKNEYGMTVTEFEHEEFGVSTRSEAFNNFGLGLTMHTVTTIDANVFNGLNRQTIARNEYGETITKFDDQKTGVAEESQSKNNYGLDAVRETLTKITCNTDNGLNQVTVASNDYSTTKTQFDDVEYGTAEISITINNFGLGATRETTTLIYTNPYNGLNEMTIATNAYGTTVTKYDSEVSGVAEESLSKNNFGLLASRITYTKIDANHDSGINEKTVGSNEYGVTTTFYDDDFGVAVESYADNNFGLGATLKSHTLITADTFNGLNKMTVANSEYGQTTTLYDHAEYGVALESQGLNNFGLVFSRNTHTDTTANTWNGLNQQTVAVNEYGTTTTLYDDQQFGVAERSVSRNNFGLGASQTTRTKIWANEYNGLNEMTHAKNDYGQTWTLYDGNKTGVSEESFSRNNFGLGASRETFTKIKADKHNGLNEKTIAVNFYGKTTTYYDSDNYGVAQASYSENNFGLGASLNTATRIQANVENGLNEVTIASNEYSTTITLYDDQKTGVAEESMAFNNFGTLATRVAHTTITANTWNGLNQSTRADSEYGTTITRYDDAAYGVALNSDAYNNYGLNAARETYTEITANTWNGLNQETTATNRYGTTTTHYDDQKHGVALNSVADNNFGLGSTRHSETVISANAYNGLNEWTLAQSDYGWTYTEYDADDYGVPTRSLAMNNFGLKSTRLTMTTIDANISTGLNNQTTALNYYGTTTTTYDSENHGVAVRSYAENNFGLHYSRNTFTTIDANVDNGLNRTTVAANEYGTTVTEYDDQVFGVAVTSHASNNFGLNFAAETDTIITANTWNGLNISTEATNQYGQTLTLYDDQDTGVAEASYSMNNFGLGATRNTFTLIEASTWNGLNEQTLAFNQYGVTRTEYDVDDTGKAEESWAQNNFGLGASQNTHTLIYANANTGLNEMTKAVNDYGTTWTFYDSNQSGVAERSIALNNFGLYASRTTETDIEANFDNGLNRRTTAINLYGTTVTQYDDQLTGCAVSSHTSNNFGLLDSRITDTAITCNTFNGLNQQTVATNDYGVTETNYDDQQYGVALNSDAVNNYGLNFSKETHTEITADTWNGLNISTIASNLYGTTTTLYDSVETGTAQESDGVNYFGLLLSRNTHTEITSNSFNGLNQSTIAVNAYGTTWSLFDDQAYGTTTETLSLNHFGLYASRLTRTQVNANIQTGLNTSTVATNDYGTTYTEYDDEDSGTAVFSHAENNFGLLASRITDTQTTANRDNGLNSFTSAVNDYGHTLTFYDDQDYGTSDFSMSWNNYGLGESRVTFTDVEASTVNGLNEYTIATNNYGTTTTLYDSALTGVSLQSAAANNYGLTASRESTTMITANTYNGLNQSTVASNDYGVTYTSYDDEEYGVSEWSHSQNNFGLTMSRSTYTVITADVRTGLNEGTLATNDYGTTQTFYDNNAYGVAIGSMSWNNFGLGASRVTTTITTANTDNGLNQRTFATNGYGWTETFYDDSQYGVATGSQAHNFFGLGAARDTTTVSIANTYNGLNVESTASNAYGSTTTYYDSVNYGVATGSHAVTNFGLTASRTTDTVVNASHATGLNIWTTAVSDYSSTTTWYDSMDTGTATNSLATNNFGFGATRSTATTVQSNSWNGLNEMTIAVNNYGTTESHFDYASTGSALYSIGNNNYGIGLARNTLTINDVNTWNGLNKNTLAMNDYSITATVYDDTEYGTAQYSDVLNFYGIGASRMTHTDITARTDNGQNTQTTSINAAGTSITYFESDNYGVATSTVSNQNFGLLSSRNSTTINNANTYTGQNIETWAYTDFGMTYSTYDSWGYGTINSSISDNYYGVDGSRVTTTTFSVNQQTGINNWSRAENALNITYTYFDAEYGTAYSSASYGKYGALNSRSTTTDFTVNQWNGMNIFSVATNLLSETTSYFDDVYGKTVMTEAESYSGALYGRNTTTIVDASNYTGLNQATYSYSMLSETWTNYDSEYGLQTDSINKMNEAITLNYAVYTSTTFDMDEWTGMTDSSTANNQLGSTYSTYDSNGFIAVSYNHAAYGAVEYTTTYYTANIHTGMNSSSTAYSYSRLNSSKLVSTSVTTYDANGFAVTTVSTKTTGPTLSREATTTTDTDIYTGQKTYSETTTSLSESKSWANVKGLDVYSETENYLGPHYGRSSQEQSWYNEDTGIKIRSYSESGLNKTWTYLDESGLPRGGGGQIYQEKYNKYSASDAGQVEYVQAGDIHWSGNPSMTRTSNPISVSDTYLDTNGFTLYTWTGNMYGAAGDELTKFIPTINQANGQNLSSWKYNYWNGSRYGDSKTYSTYNQTYGIADYSKNWNKDGDVTETSTNFNTSTGLTSSTSTTGDGYVASGSYDSWGRGLKRSGSTSQEKPDGKSTKWETYYSSYEYNNWTGLMKKEVRTGSENETIWYNNHGVEDANWSSSSTWVSGSQYQFTTFGGFETPNGHPQQAVLELSGEGFGTTMIITKHDLQVFDEGQNGQYYLPTWEQVQMMYADYITNMTIHYNLGVDSPTSAYVEDDKGTEHWVMDGYGYENISVRTRTNFDGTTMTWNYHKNPEDEYPHSADITYTGFMGMHNGFGTETYNEFGVMTQQVMNNSDTWNETITFENDGQYLTTATGQREDGQNVTYSFTGVGEVAEMSDDKGITVFDTAANRRTSTTGSLGTFTYTYSGGFVTEIAGTVSVGGSVIMDEYWNVGEWTDSMGVVHTYSPTETNKGYVTAANESFTDANGTVWTGTVNYADTGFYFENATLEAANANVYESGAINTVLMDSSAAMDFLEGLIAQYNTEMETYSWSAPGETGNLLTLGDCILANFSADDISGIADVLININGDGSSISIFNNIEFMEDVFEKKDRYKPTSSANQVSGQISVPSDTYDSAKANDPFYAGNCGYTITNVESYQVQTGTQTETYYLEIIPDDPETPDVDEYEEIEHSSQVYWDHDNNPDTPDEGKYTEHTRQVPQHGTRYRYTKTTYSKVYDGWMWVATGTTQSQAYEDAMELDTGVLTAGPIGQEGSAVAAASNRRIYRKSSSGEAGGVLLAGGAPAATAAPVSKFETSLSTSGSTVQAAAVASDATAVEEEENQAVKTTQTAGQSTGKTEKPIAVSGAEDNEISVADKPADVKFEADAAANSEEEADSDEIESSDKDVEPEDDNTQIMEVVKTGNGVGLVLAGGKLGRGGVQAAAAVDADVKTGVEGDLVAAFKAIDSIGDVSGFIQRVSSKMNPKAIAASLMKSTAVSGAEDNEISVADKPAGVKFEADAAANSEADIASDETEPSDVDVEPDDDTQTMEVVKTGNGIGLVLAGGQLGRGGVQAAAVDADVKIGAEDDLVAAFKAIDSIDDVPGFIQLVLSKMNPKAIAASLMKSTTVNLINALTQAYNLVFGEGYQDSLIGKFTQMASDNGILVEEVKSAISGGTVVASEAKLAAKIAGEMKDAKQVSTDEKGRVVESVDSKGTERIFKYDKSGVTETLTAKDGRKSVRRFDTEGKLVSENRGDTVRTYNYTMAEGKVEKVTMQERTESALTTCEYDNQGRLLMVDQPQQKTTYSYDGPEDKSYAAKIFSANGSLLEEKTYENSRLAERKRSDGTVSSYSYMTDGSGEILAVTEEKQDKDGEKSVFKYDRTGRLVSSLDKESGRFERMESETMGDQTMELNEAMDDMFGDPRVHSMRLGQDVFFGAE